MSKSPIAFALVEIRGTVRRYVPERLKTESVKGGLFILPAVLLIAFVSLFPILYGTVLSFFSGFAHTGYEFAGLVNYVTLLNDEAFWGSVWNGVFYAVYSVFTQVVIGVAIALAINRNFKFANLARTFVLIPYLVPTVAVALIFKWILHNEYGLLNYALLQLGIVDETVSFFSADFAMHAVVWVGNWKFSIFVVLLVLARLQAIDDRMYELATVNGASWYNRFIDVTLPHLKGVLFLVVLLRSVYQFNKFDMIYLLTQGGPLNETTTMVIQAYELAFDQFRGGLGAAMTVFMFLLLAVTGVIYFTQFEPTQEVEQ